MDGFIVSSVDRGTTLAFSHSLRPTHLGQGSSTGKMKDPSNRHSYLHCQEEVQLLMVTSPLRWKSWGWARLASPWQQRASKSGRDAGGARAQLPMTLAALPGSQGRDQAHRLGQTLYAARNHRRVCVCVCVRAPRLVHQGWGLGSRFVVRTAR